MIMYYFIFQIKYEYLVVALGLDLRFDLVRILKNLRNSFICNFKCRILASHVMSSITVQLEITMYFRLKDCKKHFILMVYAPIILRILSKTHGKLFRALKEEVPCSLCQIPQLNVLELHRKLCILLMTILERYTE